MQIWNYEAGSGALIGPGMADPCPIEAGHFLVPANATTAAPPEFDPEVEVCLFTDGQWTISARANQPDTLQLGFDAIAAEAVLLVQACCADILRQIYPDPIRQAAIQSAAAIVLANGGTAPTSGPAAQRLRDLARLHIKGADATKAFSSVVIALQLTAIDLNIALAAAETAIASAKKVAQIKTAVDAFQSSMAAIVAGINESRLPAPVVAPGPFEIPGINL